MNREILDHEIRRLSAKASRYGAETVWVQNEFSEILPFPKPLSLSLLRRLAGHDGATGQVCRELGVAYAPAVPVADYLETVFGRTFVNRAAEQRLLEGEAPSGFLRTLGTAVKLRRELTCAYHRFGATLAAVDADEQRLGAVDPAPLCEAELRARIDEVVATIDHHYREVVRVGLLARLCLDDLAARVGAAELPALLALDGRQLPGADADARQIFAFRADRLAEFAGFAAASDYELAAPRYLECGAPPAALQAATAPAGTEVLLDRAVRTPLLHFKLYESLKTIYKTVLLRHLYQLRLTLLALDRRRQGNGDLFFLKLEELLAPEPTDHATAIARRRAEEAAFAPLEVPALVRPDDLEKITDGAAITACHPLRGTSVNGVPFSGRALLYRSRADLDRAGADSILVVKRAAPDLVLAFGRVRGIVAETGGLLSHLAIVAREQGFPLVIQVRDATALIADGAEIDATADGTVVIRS